MTLSRWAQFEPHRLVVRAALQVLFFHVVPVSLLPFSSPQQSVRMGSTNTAKSFSRIQSAARIAPNSASSRMIASTLQRASAV